MFRRKVSTVGCAAAAAPRIGFCTASIIGMRRRFSSAARGSGADSDSSNNSPHRSAAQNDEEYDGLQKGAFSKFFVKPYPTRVVFEIGTGGLATVAVASVDARANAIRDLKYLTQLPLQLQCIPNTMHLNASSINDLRLTMQRLKGAASKRSLEMHNEMVGVLSPPFDQFENADQIARELTREFKINFQLLDVKESEKGKGGSGTVMQKLAFDAYAAACQVLNKHVLVVIMEQPNGGYVDLVGMKAASAMSMPRENDAIDDGNASTAETGEALLSGDTKGGESEAELACHTLPISTFDAHRLLIAEVQKRANYTLKQSPNPVARAEFSDLCSMLEDFISAQIPPWIAEKGESAVFAGASANGGLLNIASRICGRTSVSLEVLELQSAFHYCELTDALIGENYPYPFLVIPQAALAVALMRALRGARVQYLPEISVAQAILVAPQFWHAYRAKEVFLKYKEEDHWILKQRQFQLPHQAWHKFNPNHPKGIGAKYHKALEPREPGCGPF